MARTPEKLVELYLEWKKYSFPEWARDKGFNIKGVTTQDPATRKRLSIEGRALVKELKSVKRAGKTDDIDIDVRLCIDDGAAACDQLESEDLSVRELLELVAPDPDEAPWVENARWLAASQTMPRALARAQASGPWVKDLLSIIAEELREHETSRDAIRSEAASRARVACEHLAAAVGIRPQAIKRDTIKPNVISTAQMLIKRDRKRLEVALANAAPGLLPEAAMTRLSENISNAGRVLGLAEGWKETLREAVERVGWAPVPPHEAPAFEIMPKSRTYTNANIRKAGRRAATVMLTLPMNSVTLPMTIAHETYPGHLLQKAYQSHAPTEVQRLLGSSTSDEGWAHYAEARINELGIADPRSLEIGIAHRSLLRSGRLFARVANILGKMDYEKTIRFFRETVMLNPELAKRETDRVQWDHKAMDYSLGRLALEQMEREFVDRGMGDAIAFRTLALPLLSAPLDMVAKRLGLKRPIGI